MKPFAIGDRLVGPGQPTYFIADIAANHDGDLSRALSLITLAAEAGADAAKFQHFRAARHPHKPQIPTSSMQPDDRVARRDYGIRNR